MKHGDDFYKQVAELQNDLRRIRSGRHWHYCTACQADKECAQITHCRRAEQSYCDKCLEKIANPKG